MTYGTLKFRLTQMFPGVSLDLIEGWISDRYTEILGELPWSRLACAQVLVTAAPYKTGSVAVTNGSIAVTLTDGTWPPEFTGRAFRATGRDEFYELTRTSDTTGTLDRPYEGPDSTAAGYSIFQQIYPLPDNCRLLKDNAFAPLERTTHGQLDQSDPSRVATGTPTSWASYMDDSSIPPIMQVEIWPIPETSVGIPFTYYSDADPVSTSTAAYQAWMQPTALLEGVVARIKAHLKDYNGAAVHIGMAKSALQNMRSSESQSLPPCNMQLDSYFTNHRRRRWQR